MTASALVRPLSPRDPHEPHRVATPLELLTDLCFVVAVAQAAAGLHHAVTAGHAATGLLGFAMAFFAIWWAWLNFTWFASAYDNDDVAYRLLTILQILGVLVLAAGVPLVFAGTFLVTVLGYVIMRVGLVLQWLRAARHDPAHRATCLRYAAGIVVVQLGWVSYVWIGRSEHLLVPFFVLFALTDVAVPVWAERAGMTPWHPHHIAERYGLFFIIVLGETILSATLAVSSAFADPEVRAALALVVVSSVLIVFSCWWLYFSREAAPVLAAAQGRDGRVQFVWGFGHYAIYASAAAVGAGLAARVDHWTHHSEASELVSAAAVTVPVAVLVATIWLIQLRRQDPAVWTAVPFGVAVLLILLGTFTPVPELVAGVVTVVLLAIQVWHLTRAAGREEGQEAGVGSATSA
ncbi:MAG: low temperature requirement protein A [Friedmanniella sp.]